MNDNQYSNYNKSDGLVRIAKSAPLTTVLALINIFIFVLLEIGGSTEDLEYMVNHGALYAPFVAEGQYFRLFTSMFLHFGIKHIASNMLALFCLGSVVEQELGEIKYISLYIISGISASAVSCLSAILSGSQTVAAGASGASLRDKKPPSLGRFLAGKSLVPTSAWFPCTRRACELWDQIS